jgi:long-chain acyl-CoA synthetase
MPVNPYVQELCRGERLKKAVLAEMEKVANEAQLKGFERVKKVYLEAVAFSLESGILTPTLKLKRNEAAVSCTKFFQWFYFF